MKVEEFLEQRNICSICKEVIIHKKIEKTYFLEGKEICKKCYRKIVNYKPFRQLRDGNEDDDM